MVLLISHPTLFFPILQEKLYVNPCISSTHQHPALNGAIPSNRNQGEVGGVAEDLIARAYWVVGFSILSSVLFAPV